MISILAQERLLGAALGGVFIGAVMLEQRRGIYHSIAAYQPNAGYKPEEVIHGRFSLNFAHSWNKAVDEALGPVITYLSSRGW